MEFYANLHMHSTHSDGTYTPRKLAELTKQEGYGAMAITDHDTATAFPELKAANPKLVESLSSVIDTSVTGAAATYPSGYS